MFALAMQGWRGRSPLQKKRCHPEAAPAGRLAAEGSRDAQIVLCASRCWRSGLHCTKKLNVCENGKSLCTFKITQWFRLYWLSYVLTNRFDFSLTVIHIKLHRTGTAPPLVNGGRHEILRAPHVCGRALRMTSFFLKGAAAPFTPACKI